ncbi:hypothetical protein [Nonomuraea sp. NPDC050310]|uniref:hypothetical protein n=1 Tax=Nonomuraea sp. NPDC050310 TaxID=3154935 RepID=UPI0033E3409D
MTIDWGDVPAWAAIGLSFAFSLAALVVSLRGLKWQKVSAEATLKAANATEKATALAELANTLRTENGASRQQGHVEWDLARHKDRFVLRNRGSAIATGVAVQGDGIDKVVMHRPENAAIRPGASVSFYMVGSLAHSVPDEIEVVWDGHPDPTVLPVPPR